jgi:hypothetical protein
MKLSDSLKKKIASKKYDSAGSECVFFKFGSYGYKIYCDEKDRDIAWKAQKKLYRMGVAPRTFGRFYYKGWGYKTQLAEVLEISVENCLICRKFENKLIRMGLGDFAYDIWTQNVGKIGKKIVLIDTGPISCGY